MPKKNNWGCIALLALGLGQAASGKAVPASKNPAPTKPGMPAVTGYHGAPSSLLLDELLAFARASKVDGRLGISVYSTRYNRFEASHNDTLFFTPASCLKLVTTAAVIDAFSTNHFPATTLQLRGTLQEKTFKGKLAIEGGGDPNVSGRFFPDEMAPLRAWTDSLKALGIAEIVGSVVVSDTFFTGPHRPNGWKTHHFDTWYGAEVSALSFNDNCYNVVVTPGKPGSPAQVKIEPEVGYIEVRNHTKTTGGRARRINVSQHPTRNLITISGSLGSLASPQRFTLPVRNPPEYFRAAFITALADAGIAYKSEAQTDGKSGTGPLWRKFAFTTAPLINAVEEVNQRSQNLHAELLLRHLGKQAKGIGSPEAGFAAEKDFLTRLGLDSSDFVLADGCGLSDRNQLKPRSLTLLLARMAKHPQARDYVASLATPGLDGATGSRLRPFGPMEIIKMKTGSINSVQGLSGYIFGIDGDTLAISLFVNEFSGPQHRASTLLDSLYARTALWFNKERESLIAGQQLLSSQDAPSPYLDRLRYFSRVLEGRPYFLGPTGEGRFAGLEPNPLIDLSRFDCVTYIESVMALASSRDGTDLLPQILAIRYGSDTVSYSSRNHFFVEDWLKNNASRVEIKRMKGDTVLAKPIHKKAFYAKRNLPGPDRDPVTQIPYLPYDQALDLVKNWNKGEVFLGVAFVTDIKGLDVTHTGFLVAEKGKPPQLRHAGSLGPKAVATVDFHDYLISRKGKCQGVLFFEFKDPGLPRKVSPGKSGHL